MDRLEEKLLQANKLIFVQNYEGASQLLESCIEIDHNSIISHIRLIELAQKTGNIEEIKSRLYLPSQEQTDRQLVNWFCLTFIDQHIYGMGHPNAGGQYQQMIDQYPEFTAAYYGLGLFMEGSGDQESAIECHEKAISIDAGWSFSYFALSQLYYHQGNSKMGDLYFFSFEKLAPYNVYGNFNTHKKLCLEFRQERRFNDALKAIQTLIDWWYEYKNYCPTEIEINCTFDMVNIYRQMGNEDFAEELYAKALTLTTSMLNKEPLEIRVIIYMARTLSENNLPDQALEFYIKMLHHAEVTPEIVIKTGNMFINLGQIQEANTFFLEAYKVFPNHRDLRVLYLTSKLRAQGVDVGAYLQLKEQTRASISDGNFEHIFQLITELHAKFEEDPEIQCYMGELYNRMGNYQKASYHFEKMYQLDPLFSDSVYRWARFNIEHQNLDVAKEVIIQGIQMAQKLKNEHPEYFELKSTISKLEGNNREAEELITKALELDTWNPDYLIKAIGILSEKHEMPHEQFKDFQHFNQLIQKSQINWNQFEESVFTDFEENRFQLAYTKLKLEYQYTRRKDVLHYMALYSTAFDYNRGITDLMGLLNNELDCPMVLIGIGEIYLEVLRNEAAEVFYEQALAKNCSSYELSVLYHGLARVLTREKRDNKKALEFCKMSYDLYPEKEKAYHIIQTLGYAYSQAGNLDMAKEYIQDSIKLKPTILNYYYLSEVFEKTNQPEKAAVLYEKVLNMTPVSLEEYKIKDSVLLLLNNRVDKNLAS